MPEKPIAVDAVLPKLYGLVKPDGTYWEDANGIIFHTPYSQLAELQARALTSRGLVVKVKVIC